TPLAIADLEKAIALSQQTEKRSYHARAYAALGEAYWRLNDLERARQIWREALQLFPSNEELQVLLGQDDKALNMFLTAHFEPGKRVDTNVSPIWEEEELQARPGQNGKALHTSLPAHLEPEKRVDTKTGGIPEEADRGE